MRQALRVCGGGIVGVDVAGNREPLTRIAVGSPFGSVSLPSDRDCRDFTSAGRRTAGVVERLTIGASGLVPDFDVEPLVGAALVDGFIVDGRLAHVSGKETEPSGTAQDGCSYIGAL